MLSPNRVENVRLDQIYEGEKSTLFVRKRDYLLG